MSNLIRAGIKRMFKSRVFWLCAGFMYVFSIFTMAVNKAQVFEEIDLLIFMLYGVILLLGVVPVFVSVFTGAGEDDAVRNEIIVGHKRRDIYCSRLVVCIVAALLLHIVYLISLAFPGALMFKHIGMLSFKDVAVRLLVSIPITAVITAFDLLICMNSQTRVKSAIIVLIAAFCFFMVSNYIYAKLEESKFFSNP